MRAPACSVEVQTCAIREPRTQPSQGLAEWPAEPLAHELIHQWAANQPGQDFDGDGLTDAFEQANAEGYNLNWRDPDTYDVAGAIGQWYADYGDEEFLARKQERTPGPVHADRDWSNINGKNWSQ